MKMKHTDCTPLTFLLLVFNAKRARSNKLAVLSAGDNRHLAFVLSQDELQPTPFQQTGLVGQYLRHCLLCLGHLTPVV